MNAAGLTVLLLAVASVIFVTILTVATLRFFIRKSGTGSLYENGVVLTDHGIEFLRFFWIGKAKAKYDEIQSVELLPLDGLPTFLKVFHYGLLMRWIYTRPSGQLVVIKFKTPRLFPYLSCTPKNPQLFVEQLQSRITDARRNE
jgi:hypothetical protein